MCSNIICHIYTRPLFLRRTQKASPEPARTKSIRWALMPSTQMEQRCRFRRVIVRLIFNISAKSWRHATVQGSSSISQTTHTTTSTHLGPKSTAPRPLHHGSNNCAPNWCQRPWYLTSRLWLRPDDHEMHSEQSNFDACWKSAKFYALISECLDLKDSSKRSFLSTNQNRCKILEDHMMPKSRCPRIALKCWYYHCLKYLPQLRYHTHLRSSKARIPVTPLLIFKDACFRYSF